MDAPDRFTHLGHRQGPGAGGSCSGANRDCCWWTNIFEQARFGETLKAGGENTGGGGAGHSTLLGPPFPQQLAPRAHRCPGVDQCRRSKIRFCQPTSPITVRLSGHVVTGARFVDDRQGAARALRLARGPRSADATTSGEPPPPHRDTARDNPPAPVIRRCDPTRNIEIAWIWEENCRSWPAPAVHPEVTRQMWPPNLAGDHSRPARFAVRRGRIAVIGITR